MTLIQLVALIVVALPIPAVAQNQQHPTDQNKKHSEPLLPPVVPITVTDNAESLEKSNHSAQEAKQRMPQSWDIYWPTLGLLIAGGIGVWYGGRTLRAINKQVAEMKSAGIQMDNAIAELGIQSAATKLYATAVLNSERAWLDGTITNYINLDGRVREGVYIFEVSNHGRTPGELISYNIRVKITDHKSTPPVSWMATDTLRNIGTLLSSDGVFKDSGYPLDLKTHFKDWAKMEVGLETAFLEITIRYRDVVSPDRAEHETGFASSFSQKRFERLAGFNRYT